LMVGSCNNWDSATTKTMPVPLCLTCMQPQTMKGLSPADCQGDWTWNCAQNTEACLWNLKPCAHLTKSLPGP
jgi:hypothetical protein